MPIPIRSVHRPKDFVHFENEAFARMDEWDVFAHPCLSCHACNELQGVEKITICGRYRRKADKQQIAEAFHVIPKLSDRSALIRRIMVWADLRSKRTTGIRPDYASSVWTQPVTPRLAFEPEQTAATTNCVASSV